MMYCIIVWILLQYLVLLTIFVAHGRCLAIERVSLEYIFVAFGRWSVWPLKDDQWNVFLFFGQVTRIATESVNGIYFCGTWVLACSAIDRVSTEYIFVAFGRWTVLSLRECQLNIFLWHLVIDSQCHE